MIEMASKKLLRQLIKSGLQGDLLNFRAASETVIAEERKIKVLDVILAPNSPITY